MQDKATYTEAGWNFDVHTPILTIGDLNNGYPYFLLQKTCVVSFDAIGLGSISPATEQRILVGTGIIPLTAEPDNDAETVVWKIGAVEVSRNKTLNYRATGNVLITAHFVVGHTVSYVSSNDAHGTVSIPSELLPDGSLISPVIATPIVSGYGLVNWTLTSTTETDGRVLDKTEFASFVPTEDVTLTANFGPLFAAGDGTEGNPFQISTLADLEAISANVDAGFDYMGVYLKLTADIDASATGISGNASYNDGKGFDPIGTINVLTGLGKPFNGHLNGSGFVVKDLFINRPMEMSVGLIAFLGNMGMRNSPASIDSLGIVRGDITAGAIGGGLVAINGGIVRQCYTTGSVTTKALVRDMDIVGGLVAINGGEIDNCYSSAMVNGLQNAIGGGLVGLNQGDVANCYATGAVSDAIGGGLVGNGAPVISSFWDIETTGQDATQGDNNDGTGLVTTAMQDKATYTEAGWNFDVATPVWGIHTDFNGEYPYLKWQRNTVSFTTSAGGRIALADNQRVKYEELSTAITATANPGYVFDAWTVVSGDANKGTVVLTEELLAAFIPTGDVALQANFTVDTYAVTLTQNGGTSDPLVGYTYGVGATFPVATKVGHTFGGWFANDDLSGVAVTVISVTDIGAKTVYAKWTVNTYTVKFAGNTSDGGDAVADQLFTYGTAKPLSANTYEKAGYKFTGWATSLDGEVITSDYSATAHATLYAIWDLETALEVVEASYKVTQMVISPNPVSRSTGSVTIYFPQNIVGTGTCTIYDAQGNRIDHQEVNLARGTAIKWDLCNEQGRRVATGGYLAILQVTDSMGQVHFAKAMIGVSH